MLLLVLVGCDGGGMSVPPLRPNSTILAFGDSLTFGTGAAPELSYPAQLERLITINVVNAGVPGEISVEGARRLPALLDEYEPDLLLLCHGGNDILRKLDRAQLRENLLRMYEAADQRGVKVMLIAVPQPGLLLNDAGFYQQLADELKIPLVADVLSGILKDNQYKSDPVHPNGAGYRKLAEAVAERLKGLGAFL
jgi:lysophospholipase L1-like esterase